MPTKPDPATTALARIAEITLPAIEVDQGVIVEYYERSEAIFAWANALTITGEESLGDAVAKLGEIATAQRDVERKRTEWVKPPNDWVARVNAVVKFVVGPLGAARTIVDQKVMDWRRSERERLAREQAERERLAREKQAEADRLAREAEATRAAATAPPPPVTAPAAEPATLAEYFEQLDGPPAPAPEAARPTMQEAVAATGAAEMAQREADAATRQALLPAAPPPAKTVVTVGGTKATVKETWTFAVDNLDEVPRAFLQLDEKKVKASIAAGVRNIKGLRIFPEESLAVTPGRRS